MTYLKFLLSAVIAFAVGVLQTLWLPHAWDFIAIHSMIPTWLAAHGINGHLWKAVLYAQDWFNNIVLCLPAAYILCKLQPRWLFVYLLLAVVPGLYWQYRLMLQQPHPFANPEAFVAGFLMAAFMLPAAAIIIRWFQQRKHSTADPNQTI